MTRQLTPSERIDLLREQKGLTQAELAERIGAHPSQISRIKTGRKRWDWCEILRKEF